jgi:hypothetical protein
MDRMAGGILILVLTLSVAAAQDKGGDKSDTPAEQYQALLKEFNEAARVAYLEAKSDDERNEAIARIDKLSPRFLELAATNPKDPIALDALVQVVNLEMYLQNNTSHAGRGKDSLEGKAIAILLRDHIRSDKLGEACRRMSYGFSKECETFLRTVLEMNPHRDVQGLACLRLAQFLNARSQRLDLLREQPQMVKRYEGLFGEDYLATLQRQNRAEAVREAEAFFERAAEQYGDVKLPYADTVGVKAKSDLHEIRHLSVGKEAPDIDGEDQDGKRFKLSDYRGKVVLLYFWSEY